MKKLREKPKFFQEALKIEKDSYVAENRPQYVDKEKLTALQIRFSMWEDFSREQNPAQAKHLEHYQPITKIENGHKTSSFDDLFYLRKDDKLETDESIKSVWQAAFDQAAERLEARINELEITNLIQENQQSPSGNLYETNRSQPPSYDQVIGNGAN